MTEAPRPAVWPPVLQSSQSGVILHVRAAGGVPALAANLPRVIRELDPNVTFYDEGLLADHIKAATFQQRMAANLLVVFGGLALLLAAIGSYGVLSYLVGQRRRDIGIRLAVGATRGSVFRLVVSSGAKIVGVGAVIGLVLSVGAGFGLAWTPHRRPAARSAHLPRWSRRCFLPWRSSRARCRHAVLRRSILR